MDKQTNFITRVDLGHVSEMFAVNVEAFPNFEEWVTKVKQGM